MENVIEDNKLIAEFMGIKYAENRYSHESSEYYFEASELEYHFSWSWLMPVVEKIENLDHDEGFFDCGVEIYFDRCSIIAWHGEVLVEYYGASNKIEGTYKAIVEFIKWYNENEKS